MEYEMVEHFGGLSEYQEAEYWNVQRAICVWYGKNRANATKEQRQNEAITRQVQNGY
jgi:hypothetical protein